jgi:uncharacterized cupin superfamily protein
VHKVSFHERTPTRTKAHSSHQEGNVHCGRWSAKVGANVTTRITAAVVHVISPSGDFAASSV